MKDSPQPNRIELLAPARDAECGWAAINCGADAVYIGAERFGARESAGNPLEDVAALTAYAHKYWARVYVTVNTILRDDELPAALRLIAQLHDIGIDGLIIQDVGLLECGLPPLPLIASTQLHNHAPAKVAFLEQAGFQRAILARELTLDEIRAIRKAAPRIELECFIHGALCVCYSGQCYLSYALGGRSGNRGQCAQPCRKPYTLADAHGRAVASRRHLLSLRDLNLSEYLPELMEAGVSSFKIEGRLKDRTYVTNVVTYYRARLDEALAKSGRRKSSSGACAAGFAPDLDKTFNRGYTSYFLHGRRGTLGSPDTPKMVGEKIGRVTAVAKRGVTIETTVALHPGDGICFFDRKRELRGTVVNAVEGQTVVPEKLEGIEKGAVIFRNHDHAFLTSVKKSRPERKIAVALALREAPGGLALEALDEDGNRAVWSVECALEAAEKPEQTRAAIRAQLQKTGGTDFVCTAAAVEMQRACFVPLSTLNALRRGVLEALVAARETNRPRRKGGALRNDAPYPEKELTYLGNVLNEKSAAFYRRHGVTRIERAAEVGLDLRGRKVMTTRYCLKDQLGLCPKRGGRKRLPEPLFLVDDEGHRLELRFDCERCEMEVFLASEKPAAPRSVLRRKKAREDRTGRRLFKGELEA